MPSGSTRLTVTFLYSFPSIVLKSSASAIDADRAAKIASVVLFIVCTRRTFRLLWRSVCSNFCTHCTDHFLCRCCIDESSSSVELQWSLLLPTRSRRGQANIIVPMTATLFMVWVLCLFCSPRSNDKLIFNGPKPSSNERRNDSCAVERPIR